jgi:hypothetical protein
MSGHDTKSLLTAVAAELSDIRMGVDATAVLVSELLAMVPAEQRLAYLTRIQAFDVLSQRIDALSGLAVALAGDQPLDTALAALPLAEMAERLRETSLRGKGTSGGASAADAGDLILFD